VSSGLSNAPVSLTALGAVAAETVADAIVRAVRRATGVAGWVAASEL
jgi:L-aminopeptidase/D-esterase-like protein